VAVETLVGRASHLGRSGIEPEHRMTGAPTRVTSFVMDPSLSMANLERKLFPTFKPRDKDPVLFDLSGCTWIEPTVLLYLIATLKSRIIHGWPTTLRLPRNENVLYFLEAWRFPEAFQAATGKAFADVVDGNGAEYFKSDHTESNPYLGAHVETPYGADRLLSKYYFEIHTFQRQRDLFEPAFALSEAAKWGRMSLVLRSVLRGPSNLLASRIVYEALANAIRHPGADTIQLVSQLVRKPRSLHGEFVVTFWDDGTPIADTLQTAVRRGEAIRPASDIGLTAKYRVSIQNGFEAASDRGDRTSDEVPDGTGREEDFLLASVFPGTTSDATGHRDVPEEFDDPRSTMLAQPGMGLYLLANTAVSVYGGEVFIRSGNWRLKLQSMDAPDYYLASLRHYKGWPPFRGNLISVRLPLQNDR